MSCSRGGCQNILQSAVFACLCKKVAFCSKICYKVSYPAHKKDCNGNKSLLLKVMLIISSARRKQFKPPSKVSSLDGSSSNLQIPEEEEPSSSLSPAPSTSSSRSLLSHISSQSQVGVSNSNSQQEVVQPETLLPENQSRNPDSAQVHLKSPRTGRFKAKPVEGLTTERSDTQKAADKVSSNVTKWKEAAVRNMKKIQLAK